MAMERLYLRDVNTESYRLSHLEMKSMVEEDEGKIVNVVPGTHRNTIIKLSDVLKLKDFEQECINRNIGLVYKPTLALKYTNTAESHVVVYNLESFMNTDGIIVIPEGVSCISCNSYVKCKGIRLPKTLSSIVGLHIKCAGTLNLRNVRLLTSCEVECKKLILPYTLERVSSNGLVIYGNTRVISEKTPEGIDVILGSLGSNAIKDKRDKKTTIYISNRFCSIMSDSLDSHVKLFREMNNISYKDINDIYIRDYYPYFLYKTIKDL